MYVDFRLVRDASICATVLEGRLLGLGHTPTGRSSSPNQATGPRIGCKKRKVKII